MTVVRSTPMDEKTAPRILLYDIENSPALGWVWEKWNTNVVDLEADWYLLCFAYKWLGDSKVRTVSLPDFPRYERDKTDDKDVAKALWKLFDEADIVIAHNGNRFDQTKARTRFLVHGFPQPAPFREVDTLQVARKHFSFTSSSLDDLCRQLGIGRKEYDGGFQTWRGCMNGDPSAWKTMLRYNKRDVEMLEQLYLKLRPWIDQHPNLALIGGEPEACPKCGGGPLQPRGWRYYAVTKRRTYQCKSCKGYSSGRIMTKSAVAHVS